MIQQLKFLVVLPVAASLLCSCSSQPASTDSGASTDTSTATTNSATTPDAAPSSAGSLKTPKDSIAYQLELLKTGDLDKLKTCLTSRVSGDLTKEIVDKAKSQAEKTTVDDVFDSVESGTDGGKKTAKVKMKNGRTLTTLVETDGKWLADTIWFK